MAQIRLQVYPEVTRYSGKGVVNIGVKFERKSRVGCNQPFELSNIVGFHIAPGYNTMVFITSILEKLILAPPAVHSPTAVRDLPSDEREFTVRE
jgi:hypothetical protein